MQIRCVLVRISDEVCRLLGLHGALFSARSNIYISRLCYGVSVRLSVTEVQWAAVHAGNTAAAPDSEVEAIIRSTTNMAAADVAAVEGRGHLALC